ncbi:MAG: diguanylate cyclase, partial [Burkholderiaceae bacterium]|nr:diguanylate cyclase [Burkholderiaceae bacterium]
RAVDKLEQERADLMTHQRHLEADAAAHHRSLADQSRQLDDNQAQLATQLTELARREHALDCLEQGILIAAPDRRVQFVNKGFERLTGYRRDEIMGRSCRLLQGGDTDPVMQAALRDAVSAGLPFRGAILNYRKNGQPFWNQLAIDPIRGANGDMLGYVGIQFDITDQKLREQTYWKDANHDALTGLPNRQLFRDRWQQALALIQRHERWGGLLFVDLNHFKALNDAHGHEYGDGLLRQVAQRMLALVREADTVARLGGDEFAVLLSDLGADQKQALAQLSTIQAKLSDRLAQPYELTVADPAHPTLRWSRSSAAMGGVVFSGQDTELDQLLHRADQIMYRIKRAERPHAPSPPP